MANYLINRIDIGKRTTGYKIYVSETKEIYGLTEKQMKRLLNRGNKVYGFILDQEGNLQLDREGFHTRNIMIESGINRLRPLVLSGIASEFYVVVAVYKNNMTYEVVSSRYGRTCISESRLKDLYEINSISGGVYFGKEGNLMICEGVEIIE